MLEAGWMVDGHVGRGLSLEAGVDGPLTSSSQCLCFKTPNFLFLDFFRSIPCCSYNYK